MAQHPWLRQIRHAQSCGQSAAVRTGVAAAHGAIVATIDGDGQNDPAFIPALIAVLEDGAPRVGLVAGQRVGRKATGFKKLQSRIANAVRSAVLKDGTRDTGCGLKAFRRDVFLALPYFDGLHRFLPALVRRDGFDIGYVDVVDRPRLHGVVELRLLGPALGRHSRSRRRVVADPAQEARSAIQGDHPCSLICRTRSAPICRTSSSRRLDWWVLLGFVAQVLFTMRFLVQWIASERAGHSVIPMAFWIFSIVGGVLLLVYALYRKDPVFIAGQAFRCLRLCAQSLFRDARSQGDSGSAA